MTDITNPPSVPETPHGRSGHAPRRATIEDVAQGAGVSVATVSRALRGLPNVADSTRQRVRKAADELSYRPDPAAARLAAGRTDTLTVAVPALNGWYFSNVVAGAEAVCAEAGVEFQVVGVATTAERDRLFDESRQLERRTSGLILVDIVITDEQVASLERRGIGLATVGCHVAGHSGVSIDDELVGRLAGHHLAELGHEQMAVIGGLPSDSMNPNVARLRTSGFRSALLEHGIEFDDTALANGDFGVGGGYEAMIELLSRSTQPTAVFALSDEMAFGALMAFEEFGLHPGHECSIMGVDDHDFAQVVGLTTVRQPVAGHGASAARMLLESELWRSNPGMADPPAARIDQPDVQLVPRSSTGPVRS